MCGVCGWVCASVRRYAWVCAVVHGCEQVRVRAGAGRCGQVRAGVLGCGRVCMDMHVCGMNFQNFFRRIESLHQRTLIRILYEFFFTF